MRVNQMSEEKFYVNAKIKPSIMTLTGKDGEEVLRFETNGDIFVHGKLVESDKEVVDGFRYFLNSQGLL
jgi:hypothetical protein